jgi:uncharacterized membrane protein
LQSAAQLESAQAEADLQQQQQQQGQQLGQNDASVGDKRQRSSTYVEPAGKRTRTVVVLISDDEDDETAQQQQQQEEIENDVVCEVDCAPSSVQRKLSRAKARVAAAQDKLRAFDTKLQQQQQERQVRFGGRQ